MAKTFISVASSDELSTVFVSEFVEGALAWNSETANYHCLQHNVPIMEALPTGSVRPQSGSPQAGGPLACWIAFETREPQT